MKSYLKDSCLWIMIFCLFGLAAIAGAILGGVTIINWMLGHGMSAVHIWTAFGLYLGGKVIVSTMASIDEAIAKKANPFIEEV